MCLSIINHFHGHSIPWIVVVALKPPSQRNWEWDLDWVMLVFDHPYLNSWVPSWPYLKYATKCSNLVWIFFITLKKNCMVSWASKLRGKQLGHNIQTKRQVVGPRWALELNMHQEDYERLVVKQPSIPQFIIQPHIPTVHNPTATALMCSCTMFIEPTVYV